MFTPRVMAHGNHALLLVSQIEPGKLQPHQLLLCFPSAAVLFFLPIIPGSLQSERGEVLPLTSPALQVVIHSSTYPHPPNLLRLPSLLPQARRRPLLRHIPFLHICCPQRCANRVRECE